MKADERRYFTSLPLGLNAKNESGRTRKLQQVSSEEENAYKMSTLQSELSLARHSSLDGCLMGLGFMV